MLPVSFRRATLRCALGLALLAAFPGAGAQTADDGDLASYSLEQLSDVIVTSVSRQEERLSHAAASIYIISASDIARIGARTLPEALRLAPNLQVARTDARNYAITARGFNSTFANKLLVLIDGRSVYSPLFSGVFWDAQDVPMGEIDRIEVISGPGATIYGANAVNGVINIISKRARDSAGTSLAATLGQHERATDLRHGGRAGAAHYRAYAKTFTVDDTYNAAGARSRTGMRRAQAGFRSDWELERGAFTLAGDAYQGRLHQLGTADIEIGGANLNAQYSMPMGQDSDLNLALILDQTRRRQPNAFVERLDTVDLQAQHNLRLGQRHRIAWGAGYRFSRDRIANASAFAFLPGELNMHWGNLFLQDEISIGDNWKATLGLKTEHNNYTGAEFLPNLRLAWSAGRSALLWASAARTVRAPSRIDRDFYSPAAPALVGGVPQYVVAGGPDFVSEVANVIELGYRAQPSKAFSYSVTAFHSHYTRLRTLEPRALPGLVFGNMAEGTTRGIEAWWRWQPRADWRLSGGLVLQNVHARLAEGSKDISGGTGLASNDPRRHWVLRSSWDMAPGQQLDLALRYNAALPNPAVPAYHELDAQWLWKVRPDLDLALVGQNLLHAAHAEFGGAATRSVFERSLLLKLVKRF